MSGKNLVAFLMLVLAGPQSTESAPVSDGDRVPVDLRRTTLVVRDIDASLGLYRDALGMKLIYDHMIRTPRSANSDAEAERSSRLVFLQANDDFVGVLGLLEYRKPRKHAPEPSPAPFSIGTTVKVFNVQDLEQRFERVRSTPGVTVVSEPCQRNYPSYDGSTAIPVMVSVITDPDGFVVELNQLMTSSLR